MLRLLADENLNNDLIRGVARVYPSIDFLRVQDAGLSRAPDPEVLAFAAADGRVLVTHDEKTMIAFAYERVRRGEPMAGVVVIRSTARVGPIIVELGVLAMRGTDADVANRVLHLRAPRQ